MFFYTWFPALRRFGTLFNYISKKPSPMSKTTIKNLPSQTVRSMKTDNLSNIELIEYGHLPYFKSINEINSDHLLFLYLSSVSSLVKNEWKFCVSTKTIAKRMSLSERQVSRGLKNLTDSNSLIKTSECINKNFVYIIPRPYQPKLDYIIPIILAISVSIPLSLKLFILKLQLSMPSNKHSFITFNSRSEMKRIVNNSKVINTNISLLEEKGLVNKIEGGYTIDIKDIYIYLYQEYSKSKIKKDNLLWYQ